MTITHRPNGGTIRALLTTNIMREWKSRSWERLLGRKWEKLARWDPKRINYLA